MATDSQSAVVPPHVCENCGAGPLQPFEVPGIATMWRCPSCDLFQKGRFAASGAYALPYHDHYAAHRRRKLRTAGIRLNRIAGLAGVAKPKSLDIGCSLGFTVEVASRLGWEAHGVDVSRDAVEFCRQRGLDCRLTEPLVLPFDDHTFDVLTAWHVIEHTADVAQTLTEWARVLKPGGVLGVETPDTTCVRVRRHGASYRRFWKPDHVYAFNRQNLVPFLERAGFEIVKAPFVGPLASWTPAGALYAAGYQGLKGLLSAAGLAKAFQVFARRRPIAAARQCGRRAA